MSTTNSTLEAARREAGIGPDDPWPPQDAPDEADGHALVPRGEASISERAENGEGDEPAEFFPLGSVEGDPEITAQGLVDAGIIPPGIPVEVTASLRSAEIPCRSGLLDPNKDIRLEVTGRVEQYPVVLKREKHTGEVIGAKIRVVLRPSYVKEAD